MIISEKQLICLIEVLNGSLSLAECSLISQEQRIELYRVIVNQQSEQLKVIE